MIDRIDRVLYYCAFFLVDQVFSHQENPGLLNFSLICWLAGTSK